MTSRSVADGPQSAPRCQRDVDVPMLPAVAMELMSLLEIPDVDARRISALIHRDPALAGTVLRLVNAPSFRGVTRIVSLQQAVARLGSRRIRDVAVAAAIEATAFPSCSRSGDMERLWRHAVGAGLFAKEIARRLRSNVESAFLCGLLHNVGEAVLLANVAKIEQQRKRRMADAALAAVLSEEAPAVAALVAAAWELPSTVRVAMVHHPEWHAYAAQHPEVAITALARGLAAWLDGEQQASAVAEHPAVVALNLYPDDVDALMAQGERIGASLGAAA